MADTMEAKVYTVEEWRAEAARRFGPDPLRWRFVCPSCYHEQTVEDYKKAGAPEGAVAFSCVGRWMPTPREAFGREGGPCNYAGGGLIGLNPVSVVMPDGARRAVFDFAPAGKI